MARIADENGQENQNSKLFDLDNAARANIEW
jgi:hypothetical protein